MKIKKNENNEIVEEKEVEELESEDNEVEKSLELDESLESKKDDNNEVELKKKSESKQTVLLDQKENSKEEKGKTTNSESDKTNEPQVVETKSDIKKNDDELTEKEKQEIDELKAKLKEINLSTIEEKKETLSTPIKSSVDNKDTNTDDGEISLQAMSSTDVELKKKIALIKSELNSDLSIIDRFKKLFRSKKQKQLEQELIEKKALKLNKNKKEIKYIQTSFKSTIGLFSVFYSRNDMKWRIIVACIVGVIMSFVSLIFVQNTGVVITGMSGIFQGIARISKVLLLKNESSLGLTQANIETIYTLMFYGMYLLVNIPLIIFSYKKIGKNFTIISGILVVLSNIIPLIINLIPGMSELFIFGDTRPTEIILNVVNDSNGVQVFQQQNSELYTMGVGVLTFKNTVSTTTNGTTVLINDGPKFISMALYILAAGLINGFAFSMIMAVGGSTGGLDFISFYFAYKKNKSIGPVLLTFNISSVFITTMLGSYIPAIVVNAQAYSGYEYFFSQNLFTGIIYAVVLSTMISNLFPKDKVVKITVYSSKVYKIRNHLYAKNFNHSLTINNTTGGYSLTDQKNIEIICMFIEVPKILQEIRSCDPHGLITLTRIKGIDGKLTIASSIN